MTDELTLLTKREANQTRFDTTKSIKTAKMYDTSRALTTITMKIFQKWLSNLVNYFDPPAVYVKHVCFVNFTQ